jgi:hypothetical protein
MACHALSLLSLSPTPTSADVFYWVCQASLVKEGRTSPNAGRLALSEKAPHFFLPHGVRTFSFLPSQGERTAGLFLEKAELLRAAGEFLEKEELKGKGRERKWRGFADFPNVVVWPLSTTRAKEGSKVKVVFTKRWCEY